MGLDQKVVAYLACEVLIAVVSILGNALVVIVFLRDRRLRTPTNLYVFSLAVTDLLTSAVAMPLYVHSMLTQRPRDFHACLYINTLILTFCTVSILHLTAVSYDRYMAVVWRRKPLSHDRGMKHASILVGVAWILGGLIGSLPVMGWHSGVPGANEASRCEFMRVVPMSYLMFLFYATIITPTAIMVFFYASIYRTVRTHNERMLSVHYSLDTRMSKKKSRGGSTQQDQADQDGSPSEQTAMNSRMHSLQQKQSAKTKKVIFSLLLVIICFLISWYPLYIMNAVAYYSGLVMEAWWFYAPIILSHLSSAVNPFIYARTMPGYKEAFIEALACKKPLSDDSVSEEQQGQKAKKPRGVEAVRQEPEPDDEEVEEKEEDERQGGYY